MVGPLAAPCPARREPRSSGLGARRILTLGPDIRGWFDQAGFEELSFEEWIEGTGMRVGVNRLITPPQPLRPGEVIFTFSR